MEVKDELLKDFEQDVYDAYSIWASRACDGNGAEGAFKTIATHLAARGYRKVTTCEKCKAWPSDNDMSNMKDDDGADRRWCIIRGGYMRADDYCSTGEPKEDPS